MAPSERDLRIVVQTHNRSLVQVLREQSAHSWNRLKHFVATGKVLVDDQTCTDPGARVHAGQVIHLRMNAPKRLAQTKPRTEILGEDKHFVVIDKPSGVASVPFFGHETDTAMDLIRDAWRAQGRAATASALFVVHRIDKATSGALVFAKTKMAERALASQFRDHTVGREYLCVAHGNVQFSRVQSFLVPDRGDGLRGSTQRTGRGKRAITNVETLQRFPQTTLCRVRLETGKTHQIRIHFAEKGCPLVGETVYIRDFEAAGGRPIVSARLLLHAQILAFDHPHTGKRVSFRADTTMFDLSSPARTHQR